MRNAKREFMEAIKDNKLVCAKIGVDRKHYGDKIKWFYLKDNYNRDEFDDFCNKLDFEYDSSYGTQQLFGQILFENSFSDRGEYDGSEWWENHKMPTIEQILNF